MKYSHVTVVGWVVNGFVALASLMLALRAVLVLFAADAHASFVHWIYQVSGNLLQPFREVFAASKPDSGHLLDFAALFAIVAYVFIGYWLVKMLNTKKR